MTSPAAFRDRTNWSDGYYELAIEVGSNDDARIQAVLSALWSAADVHGCFGRRDREPEEQDPVPCTVDSLAEFGHLSGRVRLPTGHPTVCGCVAIRGGDESSDWLDFYVPLGRVRKVASSARRAGRAASGACSRRAGRAPAYWLYAGGRPVRRECVPGVERQAGLCGHGLGALDKAGVAYWDGRPFFRSDVMDEWLAAIGTETFTSTSFSL
ncbi:hypothetical protein, partial [Streptomyces nigra]